MLVTLASTFMAYFVQNAAEWAGVTRLHAWYVTTWGISMIALDLLIRAVWGRGTSLGRYFHGRAGPHLVSVAVWMFGLVVVLCFFVLSE